MPRETVRGSDYNFVPIRDGVDPAVDQPWEAACRLPVVEVGWSKTPAGHVELATGDESMLYGPSGLLAQVADAIKDNADIEVVIRDFFVGGAGFWVALDRAGCNDLVKRVRKARDDAFGKDE